MRKTMAIGRALGAAAILAGVCVVGCAKPKPDGMPKLVPCSVKVTQEGTPVEGATVGFFADGFEWGAAGTTDASGVAQMYTRGTYPGSAEGEFKVTIQKSVVEPVDVSQMTSASVTPTGGTAFDYVDLQYKTAESTPLTITVSGKTKAEFDVGAPAKEAVKAL
ncbi:MAG: hypothetical protein HUK22_06390 [Thermoguttaceae bacterium]|nr:hypothetical protein [Thermoguttaceae bacterium]